MIYSLVCCRTWL